MLWRDAARALYTVAAIVRRDLLTATPSLSAFSIEASSTRLPALDPALSDGGSSTRSSSSGADATVWQDGTDGNARATADASTLHTAPRATIRTGTATAARVPQATAHAGTLLALSAGGASTGNAAEGAVAFVLQQVNAPGSALVADKAGELQLVSYSCERETSSSADGGSSSSGITAYQLNIVTHDSLGDWYTIQAEVDYCPASNSFESLRSFRYGGLAGSRRRAHSAASHTSSRD